MSFKNPYPHAAPLSVYPTVEAMRDAYLMHRYRGYLCCERTRIGPWPASCEGKRGWELNLLAQRRPAAHAIVIVPERIVLLHFARIATLDDVGRIDLERELLRQTPELAAVTHWRIEARLVYCDISAGVEAPARAHGVKLSIFMPRLLMTWRSCWRSAPPQVLRPHAFVDAELRAFVMAHSRPPVDPDLPKRRIANMRRGLASMTAEQRSERTRKGNLKRWAKFTPGQRSLHNYVIGKLRWVGRSEDERKAEGARLAAAKAAAQASRMTIERIRAGEREASRARAKVEGQPT